MLPVTLPPHFWVRTFLPVGTLFLSYSTFKFPLNYHSDRVAHAWHSGNVIERVASRVDKIP